MEVLFGDRGNPHSRLKVANREAAIVMLWAHALCTWPEKAYFFDGDGWQSNDRMKGKEPPEHLRTAIRKEMESLDEAIITDYPRIDEATLKGAQEACEVLAELGWCLVISAQKDILGRIHPHLAFKAEPANKALRTIYAVGLQALVQQVWKFSKRREAEAET